MLSQEYIFLLLRVEKAPEERHLLELLSAVSDKWYEIGELLKVPECDLNGLTTGNLSNTVKLSKVLQKWINMRNNPVQWKIVIAVVEGPVIQNKDLGLKIRQFLEQPDIVSYYRSSYAKRMFGKLLKLILSGTSSDISVYHFLSVYTNII